MRSLVLCALLAVGSGSFQHTQCFNNYGEVSGASLVADHTAALIQGFQLLETQQLPVPRERLLRSSIGLAQGLPAECFSGNVSGEPALYHFADDTGQFQLSSCSASRSEEEMLRMCLAACAQMSDIGCRAVHMLPQNDHLCQLFGESGAAALPTSLPEEPFLLVQQTQKWRLCAEFPLRFRCTLRATTNDVYAGFLCLWNEPIDASKYTSRVSGALPSEALPLPTEWMMAFGLEVRTGATQDCTAVLPAVRTAVAALLPTASSLSLECASGTASRIIVWLTVDDGREAAIQQLLDDAEAMRSSWDSLGSTGAAVNVTQFLPSTWKQEFPYRDGVVHEVPRCVTGGSSSALRIAPHFTAVMFDDSEFKPENHYPIEPFYKSYMTPTDPYPIPDACFVDTTALGTPSNPAMAMGGMHYEFLGACAAGRTQEELLRMCLTICSKIDFGGPLQVDLRCVGVNYDEHGVGGHCHLQIASRITNFASDNCPKTFDSVEKQGVCVKKGGKTSRPLCGSGQLLNGASPCSGIRGRRQTVALFCFFSGDLGPSEGTGAAGCQLGEGYVGDGYTNNTVSASQSKCSKCAAGSYSVPQNDTRFDRAAIPRPADFPSTIPRCMECPEGRFCAQGVGCHYHARNEAKLSQIAGVDFECPPRCPVGHHCPAGTAKPIACSQGLYQDERGQSMCKECPTKFGLSAASETVYGCLCPNGKRRASPADMSCVKCSVGMDCAWSDVLFNTSSYYENAMTSTSSLTERIFSKTQNQTTPAVLPGYWCDERKPHVVLRCGDSKSESPCVGSAAGIRNGVVNLCRGRRKGPVCAECPSGERVKTDGTCASCDAARDAVALTLMIVVIIALLYVAYRVGSASGAFDKINTMTSVCIVGLVLEYLQLLSGMMQIRVEWGPPLSDWSNMMEVMLLKEVDFLAFGCLFGHTPFVIYMFKTVWPLLLLVGFGIMILIDRRVRPSSRQDLSALLSTIGLSLVTLYPTLTLSVLMPLHCFDQPDGSSSMVAFPQVTCSSEGTHSAMIGLMVVLILMFPVGILVVCGYLISSYKHRAFSEWATRACKFLFARWRTEAYYYQVPRLLRNFLSGAIISFVSYDESGTQIMLLSLLFMVSLAAQVKLRPWRVDSVNDVDIALVMLLLLFLTVLGTSTVVPPSVALSIFSTTFISTVALGLLSFAAHQYLKSKGDAKWDLFLSHHKGGAGNTVRLMKLLLKRNSLRIFFDADDLFSLDSLFDAVKCSRLLVLVLSGETTTRPYCIGEITVAHQNNIPIVPILVAGSSSQADALAEDSMDEKSLTKDEQATGRLKDEHDFDRHVAGLEEDEAWQPSEDALYTLAPHGLHAQAMKAAINHLATLTVMHCDSAEDAVEQLRKRLPKPQMTLLGKQRKNSAVDFWLRSASFKLGASKTKAEKKPYEEIERSTKVKYVIVGDMSNPEAVAVCTYMQLAMEEKMQQPLSFATLTERTSTYDGVYLPPEKTQLLSQASVLLVVLTKGLLHWPPAIAAIALAVRAGVKLQPVMGEATFNFPSKHFYHDMVTTGEPLGRSPEEMEERLYACWRPANIPSTPCRGSTTPFRGATTPARTPKIGKEASAFSAGTRTSTMRDRASTKDASAEDLLAELTTKEACKALKMLFRQLAVPFDVNYKSERMIEAQVEDLVKRLKRIESKKFRQASIVSLRAGAPGAEPSPLTRATSDDLAEPSSSVSIAEKV